MPNKLKITGFTLIELLITLSIITVVLAIAIPNYNNFLQKGRDSKRLSDLKTIQSALVTYRSDQGYFPSSLVINQPLTNTPPTKTYLQKVPGDPLSSYPDYVQFLYLAKPDDCNNTSSICSSYCLYANLENSNDTDRVSACTDRYEYNLELSSP